MKIMNKKPVNQTLLFLASDENQDAKTKTIINDINTRDAAKQECLEGLKYACQHPNECEPGHIAGIERILTIIKALEI